MKQFNLGEALNGAPIQTRSGLSAELFAYDRKRKYPFLASIDNGRYKTVVSFSNEGEQSFGIDTAYDLFMKEDTPAEEMKKAARVAWAFRLKVMQSSEDVFDIFNVGEKVKKEKIETKDDVHHYTPIELKLIRKHSEEKVLKDIDWEQRTYEVAKDRFVHHTGFPIKECISDAKKFIEVLKGETE